MRALVTGARGMLGRDLVDRLRATHEVTAVDLEVDVTDRAAVDACIDAVRPSAIFHCAAWTDVDAAEEHEAEAHAVNADGAANVAAAGARVDAAVIVMSTDYVFDGRAGRAYDERDRPAPLNAYGRTKLAGELAARGAHPTGVRVVRTAWLYGTHGRNFVDTMRALGRENTSVRVVDDQIGSPTWTRDLAAALEHMPGRPPGTYHLSATGAISWAGLARRVFAREVSSCRVIPVSSDEFARPAPRPRYSALTTTQSEVPRLRTWHDGLDDYLRSGA